MLLSSSRAELLPRFNNFIRQISRGSTLLKQVPAEINGTKSLDNSKHDEAKPAVSIDTAAAAAKTQTVTEKRVSDSPKMKGGDNLVKSVLGKHAKINDNNDLMSALAFLKNEKYTNTPMKNLFQNIDNSKASTIAKSEVKKPKTNIVAKLEDINVSLFYLLLLS